MDFSNDPTNLSGTPAVAPAKRSRIRWLTTLVLLMVGVTVITALIAVYDFFSYILAYMFENLSLAEVRDYQKGRSLFWPALLVTSILWLWNCLAERSRMLVPAIVLAGLAVYGLMTWTITDDVEGRAPFSIRTWACPPGTRDFMSRDPRCAEFPANDVSWFLIADDFSQSIPLTDYEEPTSRQGNLSTWEGLPDAERYVVYFANNASVERYERVVLITLRDNAAWGHPGSMFDTALHGGMWVGKVEIDTSMQGIDVYLIPAVSPAPATPATAPVATPTSPGR